MLISILFLFKDLKSITILKLCRSRYQRKPICAVDGFIQFYIPFN